MLFTNEDLRLYRALNNTSTSSNGGAISTNMSVSGTKNNIFPDITYTEKTNGSSLWRKVFWKNVNPNNLALRYTSAVMTQYTPGDDWVVFCKGTHNDTQYDIQNTTRFYSAAKLKNAVYTGHTQFTVELEDTSINIFDNLDSIRIGNVSYNEVHNNISIQKSGADVLISLEHDDQISNTFEPTDTIVSSIVPLDDMYPHYINLTNTSSSGVLDVNDSDIQLFNLGTEYQLWTIKFYTNTQFTFTGNTLGYITEGNIHNNFSPINPVYNMPYLYLDDQIWQGSWNINDEIKFLTVPAMVSLWFRRTVVPGSSSTYNNFKHIIRGQAATQ